jgi:hypothetical protein
MRAALAIVLTLLSLPSLAAATPTASVEDAWLGSLTDRVIGDLAAGKPLVVEVHVPLCDNSIIACGNPKLGDGNSPDTNLYWSTTPGFGEWFTRRNSGWKRIHHRRDLDADILALEVYRRTMRAPAAWRKRGAPATFELDIVVHGWRGKSIDKALAAYAHDVSGGAARTIQLDDTSTLAAGGAAQIVAYVGHNRLMDLDTYAWPTPGAAVQGTIAIACHTAVYLEDALAGDTRVPLLMTRDLLFSNAAPLEAAVLAFASGGDYASIRLDATTAYAGVQKETVVRMYGVFSNPADRRWSKRKP